MMRFCATMCLLGVTLIFLYPRKLTFQPASFIRDMFADKSEDTCTSL